MDPATGLGLILICIGVFVGGLMDGVSPMTFFGTPASFLIVLVSALFTLVGSQFSSGLSDLTTQVATGSAQAPPSPPATPPRAGPRAGPRAAPPAPP